jgi:hypothetical protein
MSTSAAAPASREHLIMGRQYVDLHEGDLDGPLVAFRAARR